MYASGRGVIKDPLKAHIWANIASSALLDDGRKLRDYLEQSLTPNQLDQSLKLARNCVEKEYKEILLVTGKGIHSDNPTDVYTSDKLNKIRYSVPEFIKNDPDLLRLVVSVNPAEKKDGGDGALLIKLKTL